MSITNWEDQNLRSHARIAARLAQYAAQDILYVRGIGWHYWDGKRWAVDHDNVQAHRILKHVLEMSWTEAMGNKDLQADVNSAMTAYGAKGVLDLTKNYLYAAEVDADPYTLNCENGTLDLHTLELRPHNSMDYITKLANASYDPDSTSERWTNFLESALPDDSVRRYLQTYIGLALIGTVREHLLTIATGSGRNGKGVLKESLQHALGDYAISVDSDMLISSRHGDKKSASEQAAMMELRGARLVSMSELPKGVKMDESTMKNLTGGDTVTAKHMGQNPVNFAPSHSFLMLTNDLPKVDPDAQAVWDRLRVVPFDVSFRGREDHSLTGDLQLAADAILTWAVEGLRSYQQEGLKPPARVLESTRDYHNEQDSISRFIADECVTHADARALPAELLDAYNAWAAVNGERQLTGKAFAPKIRDKNFDRQPGGNRYWLGIGLLTEYGNLQSETADQGKGQVGHILPVNRNREILRDDWEEVPNVPKAESSPQEFDFQSEFEKLWNQE